MGWFSLWPRLFSANVPPLGAELFPLSVMVTVPVAQPCVLLLAGVNKTGSQAGVVTPATSARKIYGDPYAMVVAFVLVTLPFALKLMILIFSWLCSGRMVTGILGVESLSLKAASPA